jgi:hypothetical protein
MKWKTNNKTTIKQKQNKQTNNTNNLAPYFIIHRTRTWSRPSTIKPKEYLNDRTGRFPTQPNQDDNAGQTCCNDMREPVSIGAMHPRNGEHAPEATGYTIWGESPDVRAAMPPMDTNTSMFLTKQLLAKGGSVFKDMPLGPCQGLAKALAKPWQGAKALARAWRLARAQFFPPPLAVPPGPGYMSKCENSCCGCGTAPSSRQDPSVREASLKTTSTMNLKLMPESSWATLLFGVFACWMLWLRVPQLSHMLAAKLGF